MFFMKIDYPQVDLPLEMLAWTDVTEDILNVYKQSCKLRACIMAVCTEGTMKASINLLDYEIHPNNVVTLLPGTIIQFKEKTERVRLCFAGFSAACVARINLIQTIGSVYSKMIGQPIISLPPGSTLTYLKEYIALLSRMSCDGSFTLPPELADLSLQTILTSIKLIYRGIPEQESSSNRKKEIYMQLIQSIIEHYKTERRAQFYADELGISLNDDEAASISLHIINAENSLDRVQESLQSVKMVDDILQIICFQCGCDPDADSLSYQRLVTHVKFFVMRVLRSRAGKPLSRSDLPGIDARLAQMIETSYPRAHEIADRVREFAESTCGIRIADEEVSYLTINIERILRGGEKN